jgi:hypothetical protein
MLVSKQLDSAHSYETVFMLGTEKPLFLWVSACPDPSCKCRTALAVLTDAGAEAAQLQGAIAREARKEGSVEIATRLKGVPHFFLTIDSGTIYWHSSGEWMNVSTEARISPVVPYVSGELLDEVARLWRRARGEEENPESALLQKEDLTVSGWEPGTLLAWDSLDLHLRMDIYEYDHQKRTYRSLERYCPNPRCTCGKVSISFLVLRKKSWNSIGNVVVPVSGAPRFEHSERDADMLHELWDAYQARYPDYKARLARRDAVMKIFGTRFLAATRT